MIGELIKEKRKQRGWTQTEVALKSGVDRTVICRLENGKKKQPRAETWLKLCRALNIPNDLILQERDNNNE